MGNEDPIHLWQHVHGATTHFPIALAFVAVAFDLGALFFKKQSWRTVGFWILFAAAILILPAIASGLYGVNIDASGKETLAAGGYVLKRVEWHRNMGLIGGGLLYVPMLWRVIKKDNITGWAYVVCILLETLATGFIGITGYHGAYVPKGY